MKPDATRARGRGLSCGQGQRGRGGGRNVGLTPTTTSITTTDVCQRESDLLSESSTSNSVSESDDAQASSVVATRATSSTTKPCRMSSVRASGDDTPVPVSSSQFNLSTVWVGNVAIVRRDDQGASGLVLVIIVRLLNL